MTLHNTNKDTRQTHTFPRVLYVSLWFPLPSETFVFYEVDALYKRNLPVHVVSLYGPKTKNLAPHMQNISIPVEHMGISAFGSILAALWRRFRKSPKKCFLLMKDILFRRWRDKEMYAENLWAAVAGFYVAERCKDLGIEHIHAAWANGPATAAYVAHKLEGIAYSFTARARDVSPPDGFLQEKLAACAFARADSSSNIPHMASYLSATEQDKLHLVYNVATLPACNAAKVPMQEPYKVLGIGRLVEQKGFSYLLDAVAQLVREGIDVRLSIAGSGDLMQELQQQIKQLSLEQHAIMLGFVAHDAISQAILESDMLVMPSVVEEGTGFSDGLPTVVIEAMCHSLPVIGTQVASMGDVIKHGETGYLVPQRDALALAHAMRALWQDRENALRMAENAKTLVDTLFDPSTNIDTMCQLFCKYTPQKNKS